ncbi:MAG: cytochrome d ubiquinol oxidase subunit II [Acidobacteria bacterium]|nr:cytochrome d ubiquinol oxidase subunit II [Acidobacteriota bacterium]
MMGTIWFWIVGAMLTAYVVLDGFDIGVGALHLLLARTEDEKRLVLRSIGPVWDGNEVWLIAGGGTLYFAFPLVYAASFSGFYLPLMIVLWLLILRGLSIELRGHIGMGVWRAFFDGLFALSSVLLAVFYGAALANVIRGVPLEADSYFFLPLWTNWRVGPSPGILDWYTVTGGVLALIALAVHGAAYLAVKTIGDLQQRARRTISVLWIPLIAITALSLIATMAIRPQTLDNYKAFPIAFLIPAGVIASLIALLLFSRRGNDRRAFTASCVYLALMMIGAAAGLYPALLPSIIDPKDDLTIARSITGHHAQAVGLAWWTFGIALAIMYFVIIYRMFRGKVDLESEGY